MQTDSHTTGRSRLITMPWLVALSCQMAVMAAVAAYFLWAWYRGEGLPLRPVLVWAFANFATAGIFLLYGVLTLPEGSGAAAFFPKLTILLVGGVFGFTTFALGILLALEPEWWKVLLAGREEWRKSKPWIAVGLSVAGLLIMFVCLLAARSEERKSAGFRRLLYGYNAVLNGLLLLMILVFVNAVAYFQATQVSDWTASNIYTLSPQTVSFLKRLELPVNVVVTLDRRGADDPTVEDMRVLLANFRNHTDQITETFLDPGLPREEAQARRLGLELNLPEWRDGVIVSAVVGGKRIAQFLKREPDLQQIVGGRMGDRTARDFRGEAALLGALIHLQEGKTVRKVYFTQDSGELRLDDVRPGSLEGSGLLAELLSGAGFEVLPLSLVPDPLQPAAKPPRVPDDAFCVVVAGPQREIGQSTVDALREYMKRGPSSRLIVLLGLMRHHPPDGPFIPPGQERLDALLREFGVEVTRNIILNTDSTDPLLVDATVHASPQGRAPPSQLPPTDAAFQSGFARLLLRVYKVRAVQLFGQKHETAPLLVTTLTHSPNFPQPLALQWAEPLKEDPDTFLRKISSNRAAVQERLLRTGPIPLGATVREAIDPARLDFRDPHAELRQGPPRMIVFGSSELASNAQIPASRAFVISWFNWLRDRAELVSGIEPKRRSDYQFTTKKEDQGLVSWGPGLILLLIVVTCGVSVWFVRRK